MPREDWHPLFLNGRYQVAALDAEHEANTQSNKIRKKAPVTKAITPEIE